jgi:hypothetical protein
MHAYIYVCMYVCLYVHTCYILIIPPIPSSRCKHFVFLRPFFFTFASLFFSPTSQES